MKKSEIKKYINNSWTKSILINLIILCTTLLCTKMTYETNDDFAIANRIVDGYPYVGFVNYYLCKPLIMLQKALPQINVFTALLIAASFYAFVCILKIIFDASNNILVRLVAVCTIAIFSLDHYCLLQFTKTAALLMLTGTLFLTDAVTKRKKAKDYIHAMVLLYLGVCIRADALIAVIAFAGLYIVVCLVRNRKTLRERGIFTGKKILLYIILIALLGGAFGIDKLSNAKNIGSEELKIAEDYSLWRSNVVDYTTYKYYRSNKDKYDKIGISENDLYLISHWYFDYDGAASYEKLREIDSIDRTKDSMQSSMIKAVKRTGRAIIESVKKTSNTGIHILLLLTLFAWTLFMMRGKKWMYLVLLGISALAMYIGIYYLNRPNYRALYVIDLSAAFWMIYYCAINVESQVKQNEASNSNLKIKNKIVTMITIFIIMLLVFSMSENCRGKYLEAKSQTVTKQQEQFFEKNKDKVFVWATKERKYETAYQNPLQPPGRKCNNVFGTGGWGVMSPYMFQKLGKHNIKNPITGIINQENCFYVGNKNINRLKRYLNKWHAEFGKKTEFKKIKSIDNISIWEVTQK